ncbi:hypothetical protein [Micromonospora sp. NPDC051141]|uniref:hypothetical protein n=1 Tax=Micromonospora sp. NPDC051141 TaxID=3364284 RepID=UPI00379171B8
MSKRNDIVLWLLLALGLVTTGLGVAYGIATAGSSASRQSVSNGVIAAVVGALGAGIVGAATSIAISRLADRDGRDDLGAMLRRTLGARFVSSEDALPQLRATWHHYHVTTLEGRLVWRHMRWSLDGPQRISSITVKIDVPDGLGRTLAYSVEAGIRGGHAVLLITAETGGASAQATEIFPDFATRGYRPVHAGVGVFEMWDGRPTVGRVILSHERLVDDAGDTVAARDAPKLDELWEQHFNGHGTALLPAESRYAPSDAPARPEPT